MLSPSALALSLCIFIIVLLPTLTSSRPHTRPPSCRVVCRYCSTTTSNGSDFSADEEKRNFCEFSLQGCECNPDLYESIAWVFGVLVLILFLRIVAPVLCLFLFAWCGDRAQGRRRRREQRINPRPAQVELVEEQLEEPGPGEARPIRPQRLILIQNGGRNSNPNANGFLSPPPPPYNNNPPPYSEIRQVSSLPNMHVRFINEDLAGSGRDTNASPVAPPPPPSYEDALNQSPFRRPQGQVLGISRSASSKFQSESMRKIDSKIVEID